jgi:hypothetical protein
MCSLHYSRYRSSFKCSIENCNSPIRAAGLCSKHYGRRHRKYVDIACVLCKRSVSVDTENAHRQAFCSRDCANEAKRSYTHQNVLNTWKECLWCKGLHNSTNKYCSTDCRYEKSKTVRKRSNLRTALEERQNIDLVKVELLKRVTVTESQCWIWPRLNASGYPVGPSRRSGLHRQVLECKHQLSLGSHQAHHTCAERACVNPDHLQPVTQRENVAEMLTRKSYVKRIEELEARLRELSPDDPLLQVISFLATG